MAIRALASVSEARKSAEIQVFAPPLPKWCSPFDVHEDSGRAHFCVTHLKRPTVLTALAINLFVTWPYRARVRWHVVDFDGAGGDGKLEKFVRTQCQDLVACGFLHFYKSYLEYWNASKAKNTSHVAALTAADMNKDLLENVDGDNVVTVAGLTNAHC